jgi:hypothetical protein
VLLNKFFLLFQLTLLMPLSVFITVFVEAFKRALRLCAVLCGLWAEGSLSKFLLEFLSLVIMTDRVGGVVARTSIC